MVQVTPQACGPVHALVVVAARGADRLARQSAALAQRLETAQPAADCEGAHRRVIFVLGPAVGDQVRALSVTQRYCGVVANER
jgi:hypothetical protein